MKIKTREKSYEDVLALPVHPHKKPCRQNLFWRTLLRLVSIPDLLATHFTCRRIGMEKLQKKQPALFLMNHSSFIDLEIAAAVLYPRRYSIVCTTDGFIGKRWLMRRLGCIPTNKFVGDLNLVRDMVHATRVLKSSVLMYPEAGYSFDGTATVLPDSLGQCAKLLGVPVVMIRSFGAFARDPLYNNLQRRHVRVSAEMEYLLSPEEIREKSAEELNEIIAAQFRFDSFRWQQENHVRINEDFRADHLDRLLYKCPVCKAEGKTEGKGTQLCCHACGSRFELDEYGTLHALGGSAQKSFAHVPDWVAWERECVREEIAANTYRLDTEVDIYTLVDSKALYHVGAGELLHTNAGFHLTGCDGKLDYTQPASATYSLNADFNWYEIGDVIGIGDKSVLYYCFPKDQSVSVAKARLATEELYKLCEKPRRRTRKKQEAAR